MLFVYGGINVFIRVHPVSVILFDPIISYPLLSVISARDTNPHGLPRIRILLTACVGAGADIPSVFLPSCHWKSLDSLDGHEPWPQ
jgi:hypothetical protein